VAAVNPQNTTSTTDRAENSTQPRRIPFLALVLMFAVVMLAFYIGTNILTVLFAVVSPPNPPLPDNLTLTSHDSPAYGVDTWKYSTPDDACDLVKYFQENGGVCVYAPNQCGQFRESDPNFANGSILVGRCSGEIPFSIFNEQWWSLITKSRTEAYLETNREVFWIGTGPQ
jgi:hypothetical protein